MCWLTLAGGPEVWEVVSWTAPFSTFSYPTIRSNRGAARVWKASPCCRLHRPLPRWLSGSLGRAMLDSQPEMEGEGQKFREAAPAFPPPPKVTCIALDSLWWSEPLDPKGGGGGGRQLPI